MDREATDAQLTCRSLITGPLTNTADNVVIPANATMPNAPGFLGNYDTFNNAIPPNIRLNGKHCARE